MENSSAPTNNTQHPQITSKKSHAPPTKEVLKIFMFFVCYIKGNNNI